MGMLSPYTDPFYPPTDNLSRKKDEMEILKEQMEKKEVEEKVDDKKSKDTIDKKNIANQPNQVQRVKIIKEKMNEKWVQVGHKGNDKEINKKNKENRQKQQKKGIQKEYDNQYTILMDVENAEDEK